MPAFNHAEHPAGATDPLTYIAPEANKRNFFAVGIAVITHTDPCESAQTTRASVSASAWNIAPGDAPGRSAMTVVSAEGGQVSLGLLE
ncbi:hypothetical protein ASD71_11885 [Achromobacter sp. Root565]|nr:hypothetical protein ASD71_11885 [Achromobacter sp. Root565]